MGDAPAISVALRNAAGDLLELREALLHYYMLLYSMILLLYYCITTLPHFIVYYIY